MERKSQRVRTSPPQPFLPPLPPAPAAIGAAVSRTATAPLDLVKTLQQAATPQAKGQGGNVLADMLLKLAKVYEKGERCLKPVQTRGACKRHERAWRARGGGRALLPASRDPRYDLFAPPWLHPPPPRSEPLARGSLGVLGLTHQPVVPVLWWADRTLHAPGS